MSHGEAENLIFGSVEYSTGPVEYSTLGLFSQKIPEIIEIQNFFSTPGAYQVIENVIWDSLRLGEVFCTSI